MSTGLHCFQESSIKVASSQGSQRSHLHLRATLRNSYAGMSCGCCPALVLTSLVSVCLSKCRHQTLQLLKQAVLRAAPASCPGGLDLLHGRWTIINTLLLGLHYARSYCCAYARRFFSVALSWTLHGHGRTRSS